MSTGILIFTHQGNPIFLSRCLLSILRSDRVRKRLSSGALVNMKVARASLKGKEAPLVEYILSVGIVLEAAPPCALADISNPQHCPIQPRLRLRIHGTGLLAATINQWGVAGQVTPICHLDI